MRPNPGLASPLSWLLALASASCAELEPGDADRPAAGGKADDVDEPLSAACEALRPAQAELAFVDDLVPGISATVQGPLELEPSLAACWGPADCEVCETPMVIRGEHAMLVTADACTTTCGGPPRCTRPEGESDAVWGTVVADEDDPSVFRFERAVACRHAACGDAQTLRAAAEAAVAEGRIPEIPPGLDPAFMRYRVFYETQDRPALNGPVGRLADLNGDQIPEAWVMLDNPQDPTGVKINLGLLFMSSPGEACAQTLVGAFPPGVVTPEPSEAGGRPDLDLSRLSAETMRFRFDGDRYVGTLLAPSGAEVSGDLDAGTCADVVPEGTPILSPQAALQAGEDLIGQEIGLRGDWGPGDRFLSCGNDSLLAERLGVDQCTVCLAPLVVRSEEAVVETHRLCTWKECEGGYDCGALMTETTGWGKVRRVIPALGHIELRGDEVCQLEHCEQAMIARALQELAALQGPDAVLPTIPVLQPIHDLNGDQTRDYGLGFVDTPHKFLFASEGLGSCATRLVGVFPDGGSFHPTGPTWRAHTTHDFADLEVANVGNQVGATQHYVFDGTQYVLD